MQQRLFVTIIITLICSLPSLGHPYEGRLATLDSTLRAKDTFVKAKRAIIDQRHQQLRQAQGPQAQYAALIKLYEEYRSFQYDSASVYARRALTVAQQLGNRELILQAQCAEVFCLLSAGLYKEADDLIGTLQPEGASQPYLISYYRLLARYYFAMADYVRADPFTKNYLQQGNAACKQLLQLLKPQSWEWWYIRGQYLMKEYKYQKSIDAYRTMLSMPDVDEHYKAIATSCMGFLYGAQGNQDAAIDALAQAAIYDLRTATTETTALRNLASLLYQEGDIDRATAYIHQSMDDANFYNARQRKIEVGAVLPIIEQSRYQMVTSQRRLLVAVIVLVSLFLIAAIVACVVILKQSRKLRSAQQTIAGQNEELRAANQQLNQANQQLNEANQQLNEANQIKDEYIGLAFYSSAESIKRTEKLYHAIERKIAAQQYNAIRDSLKESTISEERLDMYRNFDKTFLHIFPNFVEDYNRLFPPEEQHLPEKGTLTTEMRIFALFRLGITQNERIALFLDYSANTISSYKTRVKNRSLVDNDKFEQTIMAISSGNKIQ